MQKTKTNRFNGISGYFVIGFLLLFTAHFFWVTLITPALFMFENTPFVIIRIITTALIGMCCISVGLILFMFWKFTIPIMLSAIVAGILCVDPGILTDIIGFIIIALIITIQIINSKRKKPAIAI
jgi:TRAP-type uncharacterized transport system fused permease subunit